MATRDGVLSLDDYLDEERERTLKSRDILDGDLEFLYRLENLYKRWLTRKEAFHADEMIFFAFCCLAHASFLHSVASFFRNHTAEALTSTRVAVDTTFNAVIGPLRFFV
jgi:hypothetical protein